MTLNTRDRSVLFESLSKFADPEAVDAMLAHFPTRDIDEPITRDYLDAKLVEFREEIRVTIVTEFRSFDAKIGSLRQDMTTEIGSLDAKIGSLRQDMTAGLGSFDAKIGSLRQDMTAGLGSLDAKIGSLRQDMTAGLGSLDAKIGSLRGDMTTEIGLLRVDLEAKLHRSLQWTVGTMIALATVIVAVMTFG